MEDKQVCAEAARPRSRLRTEQRGSVITFIIQSTRVRMVNGFSEHMLCATECLGNVGSAVRARPSVVVAEGPMCSEVPGPAACDAEADGVHEAL